MTEASAAHSAEHPPYLAHHFTDVEQQNEAGTLGMWLFLVTEIMFFGGLFATYAIYRFRYFEGFREGSHLLNVRFGAINTAVLIGSSLTMALAVRAAQLSRRKALIVFLLLTMLLGIAGFHFADVRHWDLSSKGISRAYYATEARVMRYYENMRLVYEIESRVRDLRHAAAPDNTQDIEQQPQQQQPQQQESPAPKNPSKSEIRRNNGNRPVEEPGFSPADSDAFNRGFQPRRAGAEARTVTVKFGTAKAVPFHQTAAGPRFAFQKMEREPLGKLGADSGAPVLKGHAFRRAVKANNFSERALARDIPQARQNWRTA